MCTCLTSESDIKKLKHVFPQILRIVFTSYYFLWIGNSIIFTYIGTYAIHILYTHRPIYTLHIHTQLHTIGMPIKFILSPKLVELVQCSSHSIYRYWCCPTLTFLPPSFSLFFSKAYLHINGNNPVYRGNQRWWWEGNL